MNLGPLDDNFDLKTGKSLLTGKVPSPPTEKVAVKCKNCGANKLQGEKCEYCKTY